MYRLSRSAEKKLKIFFYLVLHIGHGCFGPKFHISSIFRFVSIALGSGKIKIFQNFGFFWKWHTLMGKEWSKVLETQYFWVMVPQKNFGHFWRHWPAHFFTTRWMRSIAKVLSSIRIVSYGSQKEWLNYSLKYVTQLLLMLQASTRPSCSRLIWSCQVIQKLG